MAENEEIVVDEFVAEEELESEEVKKLRTQLKQEPDVQSNNVDNCIVVENLPIVPKDKYDRLLSVIFKIYVQFDPSITRDQSIYLPVDSANSTKGFAFIEFSSAEQARKAQEKTNDYQLDKKHTLKVMKFSEFNRYENVPDVHVPRPLLESKAKTNFRWWVTNPNEQYLRTYATHGHGLETEIFWNDTITSPISIINDPQWTNCHLEWSPHGSYLATASPVQGVKLWGGETWETLYRLAHKGEERVIQFSPREQFLVSYVQKNPEKNVMCVIWILAERENNLSAAKLNYFQANTNATFFKWSFDDKYYARLESNALVVRDSAVKEDKGSAIATNVSGFEWSPNKHMIVCWTEESGSNPAKIIVYGLPSQEILFQKSFFKVKNISVHWQDQGKHFCVKVDRYLKKTKSQLVTSFEIFTPSGTFPAEILPVPEKEQAISFSWEPKGSRFAVIHGDLNARTRFSVSIYQFSKDKLEKLKTLENKQLNHLAWSPLGSFLLLATLSGSGNLEFYNVDMLESMGEATHDAANRAEWDPSGRFVATIANDKQAENGFAIWSFKGDQIHKLVSDKFREFHWRPRPPSLLSAEKEEEIKSKLKEYTKKYRKLVKTNIQSAASSHQAARGALQKEFDELSRKWDAIYKNEKASRAELRGQDSDDETTTDFVEYFEEIISEELI